MADAGLAQPRRRRCASRPAYLTRVPVRTGGRTVFVDLARSTGSRRPTTTCACTCKQREYLVRDTLASLEAQIDPDRFVRIHRSAIVQIDRVAEIRPSRTATRK